MTSKVVAAVMTWIAKSVILPLLYFFYDVYRLRKENRELKQAIEDLKNAKDKKSIDVAIDHIP